MTTHRLARTIAAAALLLAAACGDRDAGARPNARAAGDSAAGAPRDSAAATASPATPGSNAQGDVRDNAPAQIRGIYLNAYAAGSRTRLPQLLKIADGQAKSEYGRYLRELAERELD